MHLVDEQHVALLERGEDRRKVALAVERRPCDRAKADAQLGPDHVGEARLAEPGRAGEQDVVERLTSPPCRLERNPQLLAQTFLSHELVERARAERAVELLLALRLDHRRQQTRRAHAACRSA